MTREEFYDNCGTWWDLKDFCDNEGCNLLDNVWSGEEVESWINDSMYERARDDDWKGVRDWLNCFDESYSDGAYYEYDEYCTEFNYLDEEEDFNRFQSEVFEWAVDRGIICEEDDEEGDDSVDEPEPVVFESADLSVDELMASSVAALTAIKRPCGVEDIQTLLS